MTSRLFAALTAAVAVALTVAAGVNAVAVGSDGGGPVVAPADHEEAYIQAVDARGRPLGPPTRVDPSGHRPDAAAVAAATAPPPRGTGANARGPRSLQGSGCYTAWVTRSRSGYFGETLWKYTHEKYYCWSSPRLTSIQPSAYACCVDPFWRWRGTIGSNGWFFTWSGDSRGGHYSFRQGRFDQVILGKVTASAYPWIKIWVYGNGSFRYETDISA